MRVLKVKQLCGGGEIPTRSGARQWTVDYTQRWRGKGWYLIGVYTFIETGLKAYHFQRVDTAGRTRSIGADTLPEAIRQL